VATFTDGNTGAPLTDFTAVIHWGDGTTSTVTKANGITGSGGSFAVLGSHTYDEVSVATALSVKITDAGGASVTASSSTFTVPDAPLTITAVNKPSGGFTEGSSTGTFAVATFTDSNTGAPLTDFTAVITWGDGTSSTVTSANGISGAGGNFVVQASHTFAEEITTATVLSVLVSDEGGSTVIGHSSTFTVADAPLSGLSLTAPSATEGVGLSGVTVATFHDAALGSDATDFTATVSWGDGSKGAASVVSLGTAGDFAVLGSHTYAEESGTITLSVQVTDHGASALGGSVTLSVADATLSGLSLAAAGPTEGAGTGTFTLATFQDANLGATPTDFTATVTWGDGTSSSAAVVATGTAGTFAVLASHTYADESGGPLNVSVQVLDDGGASVSGTLQLTVADAPVTVTAVNTPPASPTEGISTGTFTVATFSDANTGAPVSDFTAVVAWGDGTTSTVTGAGGGITGSAGSYAVVASHTYAGESSTATVLSVQVLDVGGASASGHSSSFTVADAPLSLTAVNLPAISLTEGQNTAAFTVATFTDGNAGAPLTDFTAIIQWGDGTTSTVTGAGGITGSAGNYAVVAAHTYEELATPAILTVQVLDAGGASASSHSSSFTVADAPLTLTALNAPVATEGQSTGAFTVAAFTDGNTLAPLSDFTAVVAWGDGTFSTIDSTNGLSGSAGSFVVQASHVYTEGGTATLSVRVLDAGGSSVSGQTGFVVADAPLTLSAINTPAAGFTEGHNSGTFTLATFTDGNLAAPPADFTAVVTWGDGSTSTLTSGSGLVSTGPGSFALVTGHAFADEGQDNLSVRVTDRDGSSANSATLVNVADAALTLQSFTPPSAFAETDFRGALAVFSDANTSAAAGDFSVRIDWGDGSASGGSVLTLGGGVFEVLGEHTYTQPGTLPFAVTVKDVGGAALSPTGLALVAPTPVTLSLTGVSDHYTLTTQQETVTARATGPDGQPVKHGSITFTDGGQNQTVQLAGGTASATFTFQLGQEQPNPHAIGLNFSDPAGAYLTTSTSPSAPSTFQDYLFQLEEDLLLLLLVMNGASGGSGG
jgi:hypothetical protein